MANFSDVRPGDFFYEAVNYLSCSGAIGGYADGTFRPYNNTTRGQFLKIIVLSQGWPLINPIRASFRDVPSSNDFYKYIETAVARGIIGGYEDGTFRPNSNVTRGQVCKVIALARGWSLLDPATPRFNDVERDNAFYSYIETAAARGVIGGYSDGTFRYQNPATRGQIAKIIHLSVSR